MSSQRDRSSRVPGKGIVFYRNDSRASYEVESILRGLHLRFRIVWESRSGRVLPAIEFEGVRYEGLPAVLAFLRKLQRTKPNR